MENSRMVCILSVELRQEGGESIAHCPELRLTDHGKTDEEAESRLRSAVVSFVQICARKGTLFSVLSERGILKMDRHPERFIEVPIPVLAFEHARAAIR